MGTLNTSAPLTGLVIIFEVWSRIATSFRPLTKFIRDSSDKEVENEANLEYTAEILRAPTYALSDKCGDAMARSDNSV